MAGWRAAAAFGAALLAAGTAQPASAAQYGLVVGIDAYEPPIPALHGAVNDAKDIAGELQKAGVADLVVLLDKQVTKAAVVAAWTKLLGEAKAGDTLIFTYAGHGSQQAAKPNDPDEPDGLDEIFPLVGFQLDGPGIAESIIDNEVALWLKEAEARKVHVVFVADACHSGTMYRAVSMPLTYRAAPRLKLDHAKILTFEPPPPDVSEAIGPNDDVTFLAGVSDERLVPEVKIDGQQRGALSYAFARAIAGAADADHDGVTTEKELVAYVRASVQQQTSSQQVSQSFPPVSRAMPVFTTRAGAAPQTGASTTPPAATVAEGSRTDPVVPDTGAADAATAAAIKAAIEAAGASAPPVDAMPTGAPPVTLAYRGGAGPASVPGARIVPSEADADLVYDVTRRSVEKRVAGIVAEAVEPAALVGVVAKWRAIAFLQAATKGLVPFDVSSGQRTYKRGEKLTVALGQSPHHYMTLFNLPPDGKVEFLYPTSRAEHDEDWTTQAFNLPLQVRDPPFGDEHLIAILSDEPLDELHTALKGLGSPTAAADLPDTLKNALDGKAVAIGIADIVTSGG